MPRWVVRAPTRTRDLAAGRLRFTLEAQRELAEVGLSAADARDVLSELTAKDVVGRVESAGTGEWLYVFKPSLAGTVLYVKLILRRNCLVISFHEDEEGG